jgi:hypothetical protein
MEEEGIFHRKERVGHEPDGTGRHGRLRKRP